ncbi:MAG: hypothetical protein AB7W59_04300 [Acidimicrobiia bacterium]
MPSATNPDDPRDHRRFNPDDDPAGPDTDGTARTDPIAHPIPIAGAKRRAVQQRCERLTSDIADLDRQLFELSRQRRSMARELKQQRRRLWPNLSRRGRRPGPDGANQLPPLPADAHRLWGRRLRATCRAILSRLGTATLPELHAMLHRLGYAIASGNPVKALADALGYETDNDRLQRPQRGTYRFPPGTPKPSRLWPGGPPIGELPS